MIFRQNHMRKLFYLLTFLFASLSIPSWAQFSALNGPAGGNVNDLERTSGGTLYAVVSNALYQSTNNAASWQKTTITTPASGINFEDIAIGASGKLYNSE